MNERMPMPDPAASDLTHPDAALSPGDGAAPTRRRRNSAARSQVQDALVGGQVGRPRTMAGGVYGLLSDALLDGRLLPGQPISVRDLSDAFDTSPMPVREAIRRLEAQGVLEIERGRVVSVPGMNRDDVSEVYTIRATLEGLAAETAARRATGRDLRAIERAYERMDAVFRGRDYRAFVGANHHFHMAVYAAAHMPRLMRLIEPHWLRITPFLWSLLETEHLRFSMDQHARALEAIRGRDGEAARRAIVADIEEARAALLRLDVLEGGADGAR